MFAKGPAAGATPKQHALKLLPKGTRCVQSSALGITGYVVRLPSGRQIASAGSAGQAWSKAHEWALAHPPELKEAAGAREQSELSNALDILLKGTRYEKKR